MFDGLSKLWPEIWNLINNSTTDEIFISVLSGNILSQYTSTEEKKEEFYRILDDKWVMGYVWNALNTAESEPLINYLNENISSLFWVLEDTELWKENKEILDLVNILFDKHGNVLLDSLAWPINNSLKKFWNKLNYMDAKDVFESGDILKRDFLTVLLGDESFLDGIANSMKNILPDILRIDSKERDIILKLLKDKIPDPILGDVMSSLLEDEKLINKIADNSWWLVDIFVFMLKSWLLTEDFELYSKTQWGFDL